MLNKIGLIGGGNIGGVLMQEIVQRQLAREVALVDIKEPDLAKGKALDLNQDGYVYQDPMDWNVISDEEGKCPKCGMFLVKVTIDGATKNLKDNGYTVK